jgi:two-component system sensor histidine kinase KdpD
MANEMCRKTPEELLREAQAEELRAIKRGYLKIFLGYASGVGKSFRMLDEARRRQERGQHVVVGAIQPQVPAEVEAVLRNLQVIPLKPEHGTAIDVEEVLRRNPAVCFIDGLAYDNPPGSRNANRWQDVQDLLSAGIKVVASVNVQYIAELRDQIESITGKKIQETVPLAFLTSAAEIEIVDAPAEEPIGRTPEEQSHALERQQRLSKLRELALLVTADVVDHQLQHYLEAHGIHQHLGTHERILVCITPRSNVQDMIDTGRIIAGRFHGEMLVAYVNQPAISARDQAALDERLQIARAAGAKIEILEGEDPVAVIVDFARARGVTQLFIGHSQRSGWSARLWGNPVDKLIRRSHGMDVRIFPQ